MPQFFISPNYTHEKLENPSYLDLVDVFDDRLRNWVLEPARKLLADQNGDIASASLLIGYFEGIEIYMSGRDSIGHSKEFFRRGFQRVLTVATADLPLYDKIVEGLYGQARCGFAHDGLFRHRIFFSRARPEPIYITWPKKNGLNDPEGSLESAAINTPLLYERISRHLSNYTASLRTDTDATLKAKFLAAVDLKWGLKDPDPVIGTTESQFFNGS